MKRFAALLFCLVMLCALVTCGDSSSASAEPQITLSIGMGQNEEHPIVKGIREFKRLLEERSNGRFQVEVYSGGVLGADSALLEQVLAGSLSMTVNMTSYLSSYNEDVLVLDMPFLFRDSEQADAVLDGPIGQAMLDKFTGTGLHAFCFSENGWRVITNSVRPVKNPSDMAGIKIRVMENALYIQMFEAVKAVPTPMSWDEVYTALQQGVVDAQENPLGHVIDYSLYEVQKYVTVTDHVYSVCIADINEKLWNSFSDADKQLITQCVNEGIRDFGRQSARQKLTDTRTRLNEMKVIEVIDDIDYDAWRAAMQPVYDNYGAKYADLIKQIENFKY